VGLLQFHGGSASPTNISRPAQHSLLVSTCVAHGPAQTGLYPKGSDHHIVTSMASRVVTGRNSKVAGGVFQLPR
ncbi:MAG: hypothetical protein LBV23_09745, partial [Deltaproteobacteria bacterium]|nr:hypothetical protein [Deltaproteobacteria bacterium]